MREFSLLLLLCFGIGICQGQESWSLDQCLNYGLEHVPMLQQANYDIQLAKLDLKAQRMQALPQINGNSSAGIQFGRTIDPTTNSFDNQRIGYHGIGLNAGVVLYGGGLWRNGREQNELLLDAAQFQAEDLQQQTKLTIIAGYLEVLLAEEQAREATSNLENLQKQYDNLAKEVATGTRSVTERLELEAQMAQSEQILAQNQGQVQISYARLKQTMNYPIDQELVVEPLPIDKPSSPVMDKKSIWKTVQDNFPSLKEQFARMQAINYDFAIAKSNRLPTLSAFFSVNSSFSSVASRVSAFEMATNEQEVTFMGNTGILSTTFERGIFEDTPYWDQINENFGQQVGLSLNVPIFNRGQNLVDQERASVARLRSKAAYDATKQQLHLDVQQAMLELEAAWQNYQAADRNVIVNNQLLKNKRREFEVGTIPQLDYLIILNQFQNARRQAIRAKYDYLLQEKVVHLYEGKL